MLCLHWRILTWYQVKLLVIIIEQNSTSPFIFLDSFSFHTTTWTDLWWRVKNGSTLNPAWALWQTNQINYDYENGKVSSLTVKFRVQKTKEWMNVFVSVQTTYKLLCMLLAGSITPSMHRNCRLNDSNHEHELYQK